jgi:hypothetical protein
MVTVLPFAMIFHRIAADVGRQDADLLHLEGQQAADGSRRSFEMFGRSCPRTSYSSGPWLESDVGPLPGGGTMACGDDRQRLFARTTILED